MTCAACGKENRPGRLFCSQCGSALELTCPSCGAPNEPDDLFCGRCGSALASDGASSATPETIAERRLVTVLFADLVGFTSLSEHRDPEEVRELLSSYFDRCRELIERYGGTVEKFIGDAVMAVWGTPVAREDDAERAVRAALALTQMVVALGEEVQMPELRVRAGVLTGNAAVELGAEGEGMVLGDTVNTASRLQSIAEPGTVLVDDVTRRASEAAVAYEDAGTHEVKGREQPVRAWQALRVVAGAGGARRGAGLEAPFVGREHELQAIVEAGEESAQRGAVRHIAVVGEAGSGKSRLLWEFFKYLDGVQQVRWWHHGRCLSYGEGVAYWALAEMVRTRAGILEEESPAVAREKLRVAVQEHVPDERERRLVEPRLAHLLRLEERPDADRADLFSGWRLFFERMAQTNPVVLAFEDLQWADSGLLDFIDYMLEWSAEFPIFVLTLGRPDLRARRPSWQQLVLEPLDPRAISQMLEGLAPGLPEELIADIGHRAEGVPLYAVETIRMLQDRGVLVQEGSRYVVKGDVSDLDVPETLHALVASRLDGLSPGERSLLQDASVLGQSFTAAGVAALSQRSESEVSAILDGLVLKQVLSRDDDPRSPERGQYVFLQALLRNVAYGTLARRTRKARHLAAARYFEQTWPGELADIAEILATHYLEAIRADPSAEDVDALRASARERLTAAGKAAASLALGPEAQRYFEQAAELAGDDLERAALLEQAGRALRQSGDSEGAEHHLRHAMELYKAAGRSSGGSAAVRLANVANLSGRLEEAQALLEPFRSADDAGVDDVLRAEALAVLAVTYMNSGEVEKALPLFDEALTTLEEQEAWPVLADVLVGHAVYLIRRHRFREGAGVMRMALALADEHDLPAVALRAHYNLAAVSLESDRFAEAVTGLDEAIVLARERGDRAWERMLMQQSVAPLVVLGRWEQAVPVAESLLSGELDIHVIFTAPFLAQIAVARGDEETMTRCLELAGREWDFSYVDQRAAVQLVHAHDALRSGSADEALGIAQAVLADAKATAGETVEDAYAVGVEAVLRLSDETAASAMIEFVGALSPVRATPLLRAGRARLAAWQAHQRGDPRAAEALELEAIDLLRSVGARPLLAQTLLQHGARHGDADSLAAARAICKELGATRWLASDPSGAGVVT